MSLPIQKAAETLVLRSREGDQNAMGMLHTLAQNRKSGNPKAGLAYDYAMAYIKKNPVRKTPNFGACQRCTSFEGLAHAKQPLKYGRTIVAFVVDMGPSSYDSRVVAHIIARLRPIDTRAMRRLLACVPYDVRGNFGPGYRDPHNVQAHQRGLTEGQVKALQLGYIMGLAKRIQELDREEIAVSRYSPIVGWELGE